ncbi:MAG: Rieske 2Fe-2S domain-containing protein [Pirellulales bacterium]
MTSHPEPRRNFLAASLAVVIGGIVTAVPVFSGLWVFTDPLRRKGAASGMVRVASLESVPDDGLPKLFSIVQDRNDAWNLYKNEPVGSVYISRKPQTKDLTVFQSCCPHAGCAVGYSGESKKFLCPCHNSAFQLDGEMIQPSPSPRPLDTLKYEIRGEAGKEEIWVLYENFKTGVAEKTVLV